MDGGDSETKAAMPSEKVETSKNGMGHVDLPCHRPRGAMPNPLLIRGPFKCATARKRASRRESTPKTGWSANGSGGGCGIHREGQMTREARKAVAYLRISSNERQAGQGQRQCPARWLNQKPIRLKLTREGLVNDLGRRPISGMADFQANWLPSRRRRDNAIHIAPRDFSMLA